ncbi:RAMP superfamily CRISPR-associated protein [Methanospirillum hungatei]|uniref:RAMP superfamily CRISPR-associated protein n=1 Tax=Methanospirillum hungatei TaxID=2203 RepID=UPI0026EF97E8|nr:RAMP superfamily CRISPR-associated protein [Methanospirillum hungatei]MCA1917604.1 RAMP superfamily CRISPR-associated protein [Methanospirillum hungatei]
MDSLDRFLNRYEIEGTIELKTPMRIGGGQNAAMYSLSPAPAIECFDAGLGVFEPYIPGSSLKGILRSTLERLVRTFDDSKCCVSVGNKKEGGVLCGKDSCVSCRIFGSMNGGAKVRIRDSHLTDEWRSQEDRRGFLREQPHFGSPKPGKTGQMRPEESVSAGTEFRFHIDLDNGTDEEAGLILLALREFSLNRAHLGGGSTRGHGFCSIKSYSLMKLSLHDGVISREKVSDKDCMSAAKRYLAGLSGSSDRDRGFDRYWKAFSKPVHRFDDGHVVATLIVTCKTEFSMKGLDEPTVTNGLGPVIPGSTIKGFFRHKLEERKTDKKIIDSIFGGMHHRGRLIVSDAWYAGRRGIGNEYIPKGSPLKMYMVFDNMTHDEMEHITQFFETELQITGNTSAGISRYSQGVLKNRVEIRVESVHRFFAKEFLAE